MSAEISPKSKITIIFMALIALVAVGFYSFMDAQKEQMSSAAQQTKALIGGPFNLTNHHGVAVTQKDFEGKYILIYFGYANCPDVCPVDLQVMSDAYAALNKNQKDLINLMFVTIDPERDTVKQLAVYVPLFNDDLMGYTGTLEQIKNIKKTYRVYAAKAVDDSATDYTMDHSNMIYVMDKKGDYIKHFSFGTKAEVITEYLKKNIK
jgi:protein SCO1/2